MLTVLVVSDIRIYRDGLREILCRSGQITVVGVAASPAETLGYLARSPVDVVLLDMGTLEALTLTQAISCNFSQVKVVAFGLSDCKDDIIAYAEAGISGYVSKDGSVDELISAILRAPQGELECSPKVAGALLAQLSKLAKDKNAHHGQDSLTRRELQVAKLLGQGLTNSEIASVLRIRVATTKAHVHHVLEKLGARRRGQVSMRLYSRLKNDVQFP